jgi:hypothetical protein
VLSPIREYVLLNILVENFLHLIEVLEVVFFLLGATSFARVFESSAEASSPSRRLRV